MRFAEIFKTELFSKYGQKAGCYINEIYEITQNGLEFLGKEPNEKRAYIREKLLGLEYVCQYLEQIKTTNKEPLEVFTNILDEMKVDKWNEVSIKWKHKLLRNWLIYSKLVVGKTHKKQVD